MSRMQDPFVDPTNPFGEQSGRYGPQNGHAAANSRSDLLASGQDPEKAMEPALANPYAKIDNPSRQPSWMQPTDEKPASTASRVLRKGWVIGGLVLVLVAVCVAVPLALHFTNTSSSSGGKSANSSSGKGTANTATGNVTAIPHFNAVIDPATPASAYNSSSVNDGTSDWVLVFSDEFNTDGRSFYAGDDPFWEAVDLHYWQTGDLEWYDPGQVTTANGSLVITLEKVDDPSTNHNMSYKSAMLSTWNKFCFSGGRVEASVMLPGANNVVGLWPAVWTMGNLGRAGYGASLDGMWPYTYDACDVGTLPNQTLPDASGPTAALAPNGDPSVGGALSFLPGQRLSRCTCKGESHPGPKHPDGTFVGRSAPEIDMFEATISGGAGGQRGVVSQSGQWAPFNAAYTPIDAATNAIIANTSSTALNGYKGGSFQQAISAISNTDQECYELTGQCYSTYGFEYKAGFEGAYVTWMADNVVAWTMQSAILGPDPKTQISARPVPIEPMYVIANLGLSPSFGGIDFDHLVFPAHMRIDYIRVYQSKDAVNTGCDPAGAPTQAYINKYPEAYTNANLTTWVDDFKQVIPKNNLTATC